MQMRRGVSDGARQSDAERVEALFAGALRQRAFDRGEI